MSWVDSGRENSIGRLLEGSGRFIGLRRYVQIIAQRVYFESPFFILYYLQFLHSLSTFTIFVPTPRGGNGNIVLSHNG